MIFFLQRLLVPLFLFGNFGIWKEFGIWKFGNWFFETPIFWHFNLETPNLEIFIFHLIYSVNINWNLLESNL